MGYFTANAAKCLVKLWANSWLSGRSSRCELAAPRRQHFVFALHLHALAAQFVCSCWGVATTASYLSVNHQRSTSIGGGAGPVARGSCLNSSARPVRLLPGPCPPVSCDNRPRPSPGPRAARIDALHFIVLLAELLAELIQPRSRARLERSFVRFVHECLHIRQRRLRRRDRATKSRIPRAQTICRRITTRSSNRNTGRFDSFRPFALRGPFPIAGGTGQHDFASSGYTSTY